MPNDWDEFRRQMPVVQRWAYFDHAAVAPLSGPAAAALRQWIDEAALDGATNWGQWGQRLEQARRLSAKLIGADADEMALVANTTTAIHLVSEGFPWREGDNVVLPATEFPSNLYPWLNLAARGVEARLVAADGERLDLADVARACDQRTRMIAVSWVGYATGWRNDLAALAELARQRGALLFVDGIQALGVLPLDVRQTPIDFLAADGHKWLLGPEGAGVLYVRREHLDRLRPLGIGWNSVRHAGDFSRTDLDLKPSAARYEGGSHNVAGFVALAASLELFARYGTARIAERLLAVTDEACELLTRTGAQIASCREPARKSGIVAFDLPGKNPVDVRRHCLTQHVRVAARAGRLRLSPHVYTNRDDFERLLAALRSA